MFIGPKKAMNFEYNGTEKQYEEPDLYWRRLDSSCDRWISASPSLMDDSDLPSIDKLCLRNKPSTKRRRRTKRREDEEQTIKSHLPSIDEEKTKNKTSILIFNRSTKRRRRTNHCRPLRCRRTEEMTEKTKRCRRTEEEKRKKGKKKLIVLPTFRHVCPSFLKKRIRKSQIKDQLYRF